MLGIVVGSVDGKAVGKPGGRLGMPFGVGKGVGIGAAPPSTLRAPASFTPASVRTTTPGCVGVAGKTAGATKGSAVFTGSTAAGASFAGTLEAGFSLVVSGAGSLFGERSHASAVNGSRRRSPANVARAECIFFPIFARASPAGEELTADTRGREGIGDQSAAPVTRTGGFLGTNRASKCRCDAVAKRTASGIAIATSEETTRFAKKIAARWSM